MSMIDKTAIRAAVLILVLVAAACSSANQASPESSIAAPPTTAGTSAAATTTVAVAPPPTARDWPPDPDSVEGLTLRFDLLDAYVVDGPPRERFVLVRAWPGNDVTELFEAAAAFAPDDTYEVFVFECPYTEAEGDRLLDYLDDKVWIDASSTAGVPRRPRIVEGFFGGQFRPCVIRFFVENPSDTERERLIDAVTKSNLPVDLRFIGGFPECDADTLQWAHPDTGGPPQGIPTCG